MHAAQDGGQDGLGRAGSDSDLALGVVLPAIQPFDLLADRVAQRCGAGHRRVLVVAVAHGVRHGVHNARIAREIGKALAKIDRAFLRRERAHDREDGRADVRQTRSDGGNGGRKRKVVRGVHGVGDRLR